MRHILTLFPKRNAITQSDGVSFSLSCLRRLSSETTLDDTRRQSGQTQAAQTFNDKAGVPPLAESRRSRWSAWEASAPSPGSTGFLRGERCAQDGTWFRLSREAHPSLPESLELAC